MQTAIQTFPPAYDHRSRTPHSPQTASVLSLPVVELLRELAGVIAQLSPAQYTERCGESFFNGNIGGHVRHCLDHIRAVLDGFASGVVDYDHRERGTNIESDPAAARDEIRRLRRLAEDLAHVEAQAPLHVAILPTRDGQSVNLLSTLGRELAFVLSHTIHHNAMIKGMAVALGLQLPQAFGYAPATLAHFDHSEETCAQ
ncbi:MAG: DinB family protein [Phycisphaerae bacterium]|nr:DinB family protein [Phycisphaerae bacterium]